MLEETFCPKCGDGILYGYKQICSTCDKEAKEMEDKQMTQQEIIDNLRQIAKQMKEWGGVFTFPGWKNDYRDEALSFYAGVQRAAKAIIAKGLWSESETQVGSKSVAALIEHIVNQMED